MLGRGVRIYGCLKCAVGASVRCEQADRSKRPSMCDSSMRLSSDRDSSTVLIQGLAAPAQKLVQTSRVHAHAINSPNDSSTRDSRAFGACRV